MKRALTTAFVIIAAASVPAVMIGQDYTGTDGPPIRFRALLSADEQSAPTESPGAGCIAFELDRPTLRLSWTLEYSPLTSEATGAHVHGPQTPGGNAGVLFDLAPDGLDSPVESATILTEAVMAYILTGRAYVNVHTTVYPAGELRGQIMRLRPETTDVGCEGLY